MMFVHRSAAVTAVYARVTGIYVIYALCLVNLNINLFCGVYTR